MRLFFNGKITSDTDPLLFVQDRGFLLGDGLFETLKAEHSKLIHFTEHYQRLMRSAKFLNIAFTYTEEQVAYQCQQILVENNLQDSIAAIRITLTRGCSERGITIDRTAVATLVITAALYRPPTHSLRTYITSIRRNEYSSLITMKTLNYLEPILARKEAEEKGFEEGIMLNTKGAMVETAIANLFLIHDNHITTPSLSDGILPGIVRQKIIHCIHQLGLSFSETALFPEQLPGITEAFQTNSLCEIQSLACINEHVLLQGKHAVITAQIEKAYKQIKVM